MNRVFIAITLIGCFVIACKSPSKLIEKGDYNKAIEKSIKKILKGNANNEDKLMLDKAYKLANQQDQEQIRLLKAEGKPENWEKLLYSYNALDYRQKQVRKVIPFQVKGKTYDYKQIDYSALIAEAKINAAEFYYKKASELMAVGNKESYRQAYNNYQKVKRYNQSGFPGIEKNIEKARFLGLNRILVDVSNGTSMRLPADYFDKLLALNTGRLNSTWEEYHFGMSNRTISYDYYITIELQNMLISPESYNSTETIRKKKVSDGFDYVLDQRGNVMKDSLGNDIKIARYKTLTCTLIEQEQFKEVTVEAQVVYKNIRNSQIVLRESIAGTSVFKHNSARAIGNIEALLQQDLELLKNKPAPFPDDLSMLYDCIGPLKQSVEEILNKNKNLLR